MMRKIIVIFTALFMLSTACGQMTLLNPSPVVAKPDNPTTIHASSTVTVTPFLPVTNTPTYTSTPTKPETPTSSVTWTPTPSKTPRPKPTKTRKPTRTATPEWTWNDPGQITAPILLYHHVTEGDPPNRYCVSLDSFKQQMDYLESNGYTTITVSMLARAIRDGADLPERPVVITFDDGNLDVYENAFPVMQRMGYVGTFFLVLNYLDHTTFISSDQASEMASAHWEIGSHSVSHPDIYGMHAFIDYQLVNSKDGLEVATGASVESFAYPYGSTDNYVESEVRKHYTSAVGLGNSTVHSSSSLYYLERIEIRSDMELEEFMTSLPW
jgi:peptidoglycan/xylan/chitin deacetylase (PgdA/CDA1 family)